MRFLTNYAKGCDLRSTMRNRNIAEYQKPCCNVLCERSWLCITVSGDHWVSGSLRWAMNAPLRMVVVLLCLAYRACSCSLLFKVPHSTPLYYYIFLCSLIEHYLLSKFSTVLPVQVDGCWGGVFLVCGAHGWVASRAGSWVFSASIYNYILVEVINILSHSFFSLDYGIVQRWLWKWFLSASCDGKLGKYPCKQWW